MSSTFFYRKIKLRKLKVHHKLNRQLYCSFYSVAHNNVIGLEVLKASALPLKKV